jgi:protocatechuate 3,4-dioxygenase beta subunit
VSSAGASFGDGSAQTTATTDSDGIATSPQFTANGTIGSFTATATVANVPEPASFRLENLPGKGERLIALGSPKRAATVEHRYSHSLRVLVHDANGSPVAGATVTFTLGGAGTGTGTGTGAGVSAGASFAGGASTATATTGIHGIATSPSLTAGSVAGTFTATATATTTTSTALFTLSNRAGKPATITAGIAAAEATQAGTRFVIALAVTVTDALANKVPGALVTFTAPASGASGSFATSTHPRTVTLRTDSGGIAVAPPFIANAQRGGYVVIATVAHGPRTAFALVNDAP